MISIGLDLSLAKTGIAILRDEDTVYTGLIKSKPSGESARAETERLVGIVQEIELTIAEHLGSEKPDIVVIEGLAFMARNTTALVQLAGLNYLVRAFLLAQEWSFLIVAPSTLKKYVTGKGNSDKGVIILEVYKRWGESLLDDNIADAFGLAKIGEALLSPDIDTKLGKPQQEVLKLLQPTL